MSKSKSLNSRNIPTIVSILLFLLVISTGVAVFFIKDYNSIFLGAYGLIFIALVAFNHKIPVGLGGIFRSLVGCLFIFSGFVKGVDPQGFSYKVFDYLAAYNVPWLQSASQVLAIIAILIEFTVGIMLLFDIKHKIAIPLATIMMLFFTILTLVDAIYNKVPDCGCFGDAVKLTNWQTFYKNLTIDLCLITVWFTFGRMRPLFYPGAEIGMIITIVVLFLGFQIYCLWALPVIDFRDWKVGNKMTLDNPQPIEYWVDYANDSTGEVSSMLSKDIPYNDSVWMSHWNFIDQRTVDKNIYPHNLLLFTEEGSNVTSNVLTNPNPNILIISYSIDEMNMKHFDKVKEIIDYCNQREYQVSFITSSDFEEINQFIEKEEIDVAFYNADDIELKAMIRSNPGIVAMKNGIIVKKWSNNTLPDAKALDRCFK